MNTLKQTTTKNKSLITKTLIGFLVAAIIFPTLAIIHFAGTPGLIVGFVLSFIATFLGLFELTKSLPLPKWTKYYIPLVTFLIFFVPYENTIRVISNNLSSYSDIKEFFISQYKFSVGIPGMGYVILFFFLLVPFLFSKIGQKSFINFFLLFIATLIIIFVGKTLMFFVKMDFWFTSVIFCSIIATDSFAYFGGKVLGNKIFKRKLAPSISPNKTIEGAFVGYLFAFIILILSFNLNNFGGHINNNNWIFVSILCPIFLPVVAIFGDLSFSFLKRQFLIKDFSNFIPEHGGILDRLDSTIVVVFVFTLIYFLI